MAGSLPPEADGPQGRGYSNFKVLSQCAGITIPALEQHVLDNLRRYFFNERTYATNAFTSASDSLSL